MGDGGDATGCRTKSRKEGGNKTGGEAKGGVKGEGPRLLVDAGIVADEPGEAKHQGEVRQADELKGNVFCMRAMNADAGGVEMGDMGGRTAVDEFDRNGMGVGGGLQLICRQN